MWEWWRWCVLGVGGGGEGGDGWMEGGSSFSPDVLGLRRRFKNKSTKESFLHHHTLTSRQIWHSLGYTEHQSTTRQRHELLLLLHSATNDTPRPRSCKGILQAAGNNTPAQPSCLCLSGPTTSTAAAAAATSGAAAASPNNLRQQQAQIQAGGA